MIRCAREQKHRSPRFAAWLQGPLRFTGSCGLAELDALRRVNVDLARLSHPGGRAVSARNDPHAHVPKERPSPGKHR